MVKELKNRLQNDCGIDIPRQHHADRQQRFRNDDEERMLLRVSTFFSFLIYCVFFALDYGLEVHRKTIEK